MALSSALDWIGAVLLGPAAAALAVIAVASIGFLMLSGRLPIKRAGSVILGCFILFSARQVASGLLSVTSGGGEPASAVAAPAPVYTPTLPKAETYDPYSGAAVPQPGDTDILN